MTRMDNRTKKKMIASPVSFRSEKRMSVPPKRRGIPMKLKKDMINPKPQDGIISARMTNMRQSMLNEKQNRWKHIMYCRLPSRPRGLLIIIKNKPNTMPIIPNIRRRFLPNLSVRNREKRLPNTWAAQIIDDQ